MILLRRESVGSVILNWTCSCVCHLPLPLYRRFFKRQLVSKFRLKPTVMHYWRMGPQCFFFLFLLIISQSFGKSLKAKFTSSSGQ
jgi:hypothetical protein